VPEPGGAFHRPGPLWPRGRPCHQLRCLRRASLHPYPAQWLFACADRHRGVRPLVRVDPDHHHCRHKHLPTRYEQGQSPAAGMPNYSAGARASFEPHRGKTRQAGTSLSSQTAVLPQSAGGSGASPPGLSTLRPDSLPSRPGPHRLLTIRRVGARSSRRFPSLSVTAFDVTGAARLVLRSCWARCLSMLRANGAAVAARSRRTRRALCGIACALRCLQLVRTRPRSSGGIFSSSRTSTDLVVLAASQSRRDT